MTPETLTSNVRLLRVASAELRARNMLDNFEDQEREFKIAVANWLDDALEAHLSVRPGNWPSFLKAVEVAKAVVGGDD